MKPFLLFLNGPENETKQQLCAILQRKFSDQVCVYINRKMQLKMFNNKQDEDESYEWLIHKMLKHFIVQGVFVIFDGFLQTRRTKQYAQSLDGLPLYWIGLFFSAEKSEMSKEFYDFHVFIDEAEYAATEDKESFLNLKAEEIFEYVKKNDPVCFDKTNEVERVARKREVYNKDRSFVDMATGEGDKSSSIGERFVSSRENGKRDFKERPSFSKEFGSGMKDGRSNFRARGGRPSFGNDNRRSRDDRFRTRDDRKGEFGFRKDDDGFKSRGRSSRDGERGRFNSFGNRAGGFKSGDNKEGFKLRGEFSRDGKSKAFGKSAGVFRKEGFKSDAFSRDGDSRRRPSSFGGRSKDRGFKSDRRGASFRGGDRSFAKGFGFKAKGDLKVVKS